MSLKTELIGIILILLTIFPILFIIKSKRKKEKEFLQTLFDLANLKKFKIEDHEMWKNAVIGIDKMNHQLFFIRTVHGLNIKKIINLSDTFLCKLVTSNKTQSIVNAYQNSIQKIELVFMQKKNNEAFDTLEIYNSDFDNLTLSGELQIAEKWTKIINSSIQNKIS